MTWDIKVACISGPFSNLWMGTLYFLYMYIIDCQFDQLIISKILF